MLCWAGAGGFQRHTWSFISALSTTNIAIITPPSPSPQTFHEVDKGVKGYLDSKDMLRALIKLGVLDGYTKR